MVRFDPSKFRPAATLLLALLTLAAPALAADGPDHDSYDYRFDRAWSLVDERYWDLEAAGVDWDAIGEEYRPRALAATDDGAFYAVLEEMYAEIGDDHSVFVPPARVEEFKALYGSQPCVAVFANAPFPAFEPLAPSQAPFLLAQALPELNGLQKRANLEYGLTDEGVGYLRLPDLISDGVTAAVRAALGELTDLGAWAFVLDLRDNPGGRMLTMMEVAGAFTTGLLWRTVVTWSLPLPYPAIGVPVTDAPLAVLIDGGVNSAAEGLSGALQARGRAVIVGERSAGNVEALLPFCLRDGSQAWIASGVLAPLLGRTWEGVGVQPDVESSSEDAPAAAIEWLLDNR